MLNGWTPESNNESKECKNGTKRLSDDSDSPQPKRRKRASQPRKPEEKSKASKAAARRKSKPDASEKQGKPPPSPAFNKKRARESRNEPEDADEQGASETEDDQVAQSKSKVESDDGKKSPVLKPIGAGQDGAKAEESITTLAGEEEDYSDVIDELPQPKRKKKDKNEPSSKSSKSAPKKVSAPTTDDSDEAEIKKLQSQLVKCGIRKLWHNELKRYDDDARAKIRHLKKMLADIGMDGRFSEAKAREIKETRELMTDAEAAQEMNALWGTRSGGRASRSKNKPTKREESEASGTDEKEPQKGDDNDEDDTSNTFAARRRRAQADLAFLGDDSDSD